MTTRVKLITDSTCDLPREWIERWDIAMLYPYVNFDEESFVDDGVALPTGEFYRRLAADKRLPKTSAFGVGAAQEAFSRQLAKAEHVVAITVASRFSSIYNTVRLAAQEFGESKVTVIDSGMVTMAAGWIVAAAAEAAQDGCGVTEVVTAANDTRERVKLYAVIDNLDYLRRSGRVSSFVASIGTILQIKPIIEVTGGQVNSIQRVRTMNKAVQSLVELAQGQAPLEKLAILHANNLTGAAELRDRLADIAPANTVTIEIGTALGTHVGPGALGISPVRKATETLTQA